MTAERRSIRVLISGRVQGVGYRAWCARTAAELGLSGWVRNRSSGDVEAVFCGETETVDDMLQRARRGPRFAEVSNIVIAGDAPELAGSFEVRDTL